MNAELSTRELQSLAVFPLPGVVLFPGAVLGLHIFEARYREMMADCLREDRMAMAMAQLKPGSAADQRGRPPLFEVAGAGRIIRHSMRGDGTYDLELQGIARVRLTELPAERSYRRALATVLRDSGPHAGLAPSELSSLFALAVQLVQIAQRSNPSARVALSASMADEPGRMLDKLADQLVADPITRQRLLETLDTAERLQQLRRIIAEHHLAFGAKRNGEGSPTLH